MSRGELILLHLATLATALSGLLLAISRYLLASDDPFSVAGAPWRSLALSIHVVAAPFLVFALGLIFRRHVLGKLRDSRTDGRASGTTLTALLLPMIVSGYLLQVVIAESAQQFLSLLHLAVGLVFTLAYASHSRLNTGQSSRESLSLAEGRTAPVRREPRSVDKVARPRR